VEGPPRSAEKVCVLGQVWPINRARSDTVFGCQMKHRKVQNKKRYGRQETRQAERENKVSRNRVRMEGKGKKMKK